MPNLFEQDEYLYFIIIKEKKKKNTKWHKVEWAIFLTQYRYEKILTEVAPFARAAGVPDSRELVFAHFIDRVRENLHIVLCMSPVGDQLRNRFRMFPSLVNCCTIDWFNEWPQEALLSVSTKFLAGMYLEKRKVIFK